ncbi:MAG: hypothetical protein JST64_07575 [Actinobacteria bacterium]|nr:hypothetical protein [Actinomycetota bacterium]
MSRRTSTRSASGSVAVAAAIVAATVALLLPGCSQPRSVDAFCGTFESQAKDLVSKYSGRLSSLDYQNNPLKTLLVGAGSAIEAQGDLAVLFDHLDAVAPDEIEPEVAAVRDMYKRQLDTAEKAAGDPIGALAGGLVSAVSSMGSYEKVQKFITANCDTSFLTQH